MSKIILIGLGLWLAMLMLITTADAQVVIHQTIPGTMVRDYSAPSIVIKRDGTGYQTLPGTRTRDWGAPGFKYQRQNNARTYAPAPVFIPRLYQPKPYNPYSE